MHTHIEKSILMNYIFREIYADIRGGIEIGGEEKEIQMEKL